MVKKLYLIIEQEYKYLCWVVSLSLSVYLLFRILIFLDTLYLLPFTVSLWFKDLNFIIIIRNSDKRSHHIPWDFPGFNKLLLSRVKQVNNVHNLKSSIGWSGSFNFPDSSSFFPARPYQIKRTPVEETPWNIVDCLGMHKLQPIEFNWFQTHLKLFLRIHRIKITERKYLETLSIFRFFFDSTLVVALRTLLVFYLRRILVLASKRNHGLFVAILIPGHRIYSHWRDQYFAGSLSDI